MVVHGTLPTPRGSSSRAWQVTSGSGAQAAEHWEAALRVNPLHAEGWFALGFCALKAGGSTRAAQAFTRAAQQDPDNGEAWNNLAAVHLQASARAPPRLLCSNCCAALAGPRGLAAARLQARARPPPQPRLSACLPYDLLRSGAAVANPPVQSMFSQTCRGAVVLASSCRDERLGRVLAILGNLCTQRGTQAVARRCLATRCGPRASTRAPSQMQAYGRRHCWPRLVIDWRAAVS